MITVFSDRIEILSHGTIPPGQTKKFSRIYFGFLYNTEEYFGNFRVLGI